MRCDLRTVKHSLQTVYPCCRSVRSVRIDTWLIRTVTVRVYWTTLEEEEVDFLELGGYVAKESIEDVATGPNVTDDQRTEFTDLARQFTNLFTEAPGTTDLVQHHIKLTSDEPVRSRPYPVPYSMRESLRKDIADMIKMGVIRESSSPYASPVVVVKKKDNTNRVCVDYRKLNKLTVFDPEPMPTAEHLFQKLSGDKFFSKIDLSKGYWQITIPQEEIPKTAFVTPDGSYEFLKMPFGMINSAATLKRAMKKLIEDLDDVDFYWDDILVHTRTWEEHIRALRELFSRLVQAGLTIRPTKCLFGVNSVDFLEHRLEQGMIGLHQDNVEKIKNAPRPSTKKQVRSFMGLAGYPAPLSDLTRKGQPNKVEWSEAQEKVYQTIKSYLTSEPILRLPNPAKTYFLRTDASNNRIGAVLMFLAVLMFFFTQWQLRSFYIHSFISHLWPIFTSFVINYCICHYNSTPFVCLLLINGTPFTYLV